MSNPTITKVATVTAPVGATVKDAATWIALVEAVEANDGVVIIPMALLRKLEGAERLGIHVLKSIESRLGTLGLGHMPEDLPNRQDQEAILYRYGSPASDIISAVRNGLTAANDIRSTYQALHRVNAAPSASEVVHKAELEDNLNTAARAVLDLLGPDSRAALADRIK